MYSWTRVYNCVQSNTFNPRHSRNNLLAPQLLLQPRGVRTTPVLYHLTMYRDAVIAANAGGVLMDRMLGYVAKQAPSEQEKRGDRRLDDARALIVENQQVIDSGDLQVVEARIA